jgi:hypothetical protein
MLTPSTRWAAAWARVRGSSVKPMSWRLAARRYIFTAAFRRNAADPQIGRKVPGMFRDAGLTDVRTEARAPVYPPGHLRRAVRADLVRSMRAHVLELGLASEAELDELDTAARAHLTDPRTLTMSGLLFLTWARKPGPGG